MTFSSGSWTRKHIWTIIFTIIVLNCNHNHQTKQNKTRQNKTKQNKRFDLIWIWFRLKFWFYNLMIWFKTQYDLKRNKRQLIFKTHFLLFYFTLCLFFNKITHPCCQKTKLNTIKLLGGAGLNGGAVNFGASSASRQVPANFHPLFFVFVIEHNC